MEISLREISFCQNRSIRMLTFVFCALIYIVCRGLQAGREPLLKVIADFYIAFFLQKMQCLFFRSVEDLKGVIRRAFREEGTAMCCR